MNLKHYKNEGIVLVALLVLVCAYLYKHHQVTQQREQVAKTQRTLIELKEIGAFVKIWGDKAIRKRVDGLPKSVTPSKVKWSKKQNTVNATFSNLTANELNQLVTKILNIPVTISQLDVTKQAEKYIMEFACNW